MTIDPTSGNLICDFSKLKIKKSKGYKRTDNGYVASKKYGIVIQFDIDMKSEPLTLQTISLPFTIYVQESQRPLAEATILWDNVFGKIGRDPFKVPTEVTWTELASALSARFHQALGSDSVNIPLTTEAAHCLAVKLFNYRL